MSVPCFLVIGAMKSGTTSLHYDLKQHPRIFLPENKEPEILCQDLSKDEMLREYKKLSWAGKNKTIYGDASTAYAKYPTYKDIPEKAFEVFGCGLKIIYMVRDPVRRAISHHHHDFVAGKASGNTDHEILVRPEYVDYSKYWMQIGKWVDIFGKENVKVVIFEEYLLRRSEVLNDVVTFLGANEYDFPEAVTKNASDGKRVPGPLVRALITENRIYKYYIKPKIPQGLKSIVSYFLMKKASARPAPISRITHEKLGEDLRDDTEKFLSFFNIDNSFWG